jgi:segregation and condensation protein A
MEGYTVKVDIFEGPLDLLLHLIKQNQLDIYDIPIALITEQYLEYIRIMKALDLTIAGEFLVMAATLMYIKSRMLLPTPIEEEEEEGEDPRTELVQRLVEYKRFKEAALHLSQQALLGRDVFIRPVQEIEAEAGEIEADLFHLIDALRELLKRQGVDDFHEVTLERITLREKIRELYERLQGVREAVPFSALFAPVASRVELIVTFLALLELIRSGMLRAYQREAFGPLWVTRTVTA